MSHPTKTILITGGAGFIGSAVIRYLLEAHEYRIINIDKLTYASNLNALTSVQHHPHYHFKQVDICDAAAVKSILATYQPDILMHLAAESHVDNSIRSAHAFIQTNIVGTYILLEEARYYWHHLDETKKSAFRFHHISTDEVYGDLGNNSAKMFDETAPYAPSSPYSASKASADHLVRAWHRTYGLPILITNCSNNYGPYQHAEKFIPTIILNALRGKPIPIYGDGSQIRDWLYVDDHARALACVAMQGKIGETYNIGSHNEQSNLDVAHLICTLLEELVPQKPSFIHEYAQLITHITDRAGHDLRYAIDARKINRDLGWQPQWTFEKGLKTTIEWYLNSECT